MEQNVLLKMVGITKTFPGVKALQDVSLEVRQGTVHAIRGENGAAGENTAGEAVRSPVQKKSHAFDTGDVCLRKLCHMYLQWNFVLYHYSTVRNFCKEKGAVRRQLPVFSPMCFSFPIPFSQRFPVM